LGKGSDFLGTGMHGGQMFLREEVEPRRLGKEVTIGKVTEDDMRLLRRHLDDFCAYFGFNPDEIFKKPFAKIYPYSHHPYLKIFRLSTMIFFAP
jgi:glutamate synthase domain-containing protein 3